MSDARLGTDFPGWNVRLELVLEIVEPAVLLAFIRALTPLTEHDEETVISLFGAAGVWFRESFPDLLSFDIDEHLRYHLDYLDRVGWPAKEAIAAGALHLVVDITAARWRQRVDAQVAARLDEWGLILEARDISPFRDL